MPKEQKKKTIYVYYRVMVLLWFANGADSYPWLVPKEGCHSATGDLAAEYRMSVVVRQFSAEDLPTIDSTGQICSTLGMHPNFENLHKYHNDETSCLDRQHWQPRGAPHPFITGHCQALQD